jgi:4-hydroxy-tetrahydrodipicolinate reductase
VKLAVVGAPGKMARAVLRLAGDLGCSVVAAIGTENVGLDVASLTGGDSTGLVVSSDLMSLIEAKPEVVIDFSSANATVAVVDAVTRANAALVCGTTGLSDAGLDALSMAAKVVPTLWEPNLSVGVHLLKELVRFAVRTLDLHTDIEIVEAHHRFKADSPSGTALALLDVIRSERETTTVVHGREGRPGARVPSEVGMHAVRGGDVIGDHAVHLLCEGERLELTHRATSRDLFARGALRAGLWLRGKPAGRYTMSDVLSLKLDD